MGEGAAQVVDLARWRVAVPRPEAQGARVVITEYDIPTGVGKQERAVIDGSDWAEGIMSGLHGTGGIHDVQIDNMGNAWLTDSVANDHRTVVKLDVKTGAITGFKVTAPNGRAQTSHGIGRDANGIMWFDPVPGKPNSIAASTKPLANMCPALLSRDGKPFAALGACGGRRIIPAVSQLISFLVDYGMTLERAFAAGAVATP